MADTSSQAYQRLESGHAPKKASAPSTVTATVEPVATIAPTSKTLWFFNRASSVTVLPKPKSRVKNKPDEETEREWLLLGEPQSPRNTVMLDDSHDIIDTSILTVAEPLPSVSENTHEAEADAEDDEEPSDSESSTDIDAIVDEYRQKFKVLLIPRPGH